MNNLLRALAPLPAEAWELVDAEARRVLTATLAARRVVDFVGPLGWPASSISLGRTVPAAAEPAPGVRAAVRSTQPLVELRAEFELDRAELERASRGANDVDLTPLVRAATAIAYAEDRMVFDGFAAGGQEGISKRSPHPVLRLQDDFDAYPSVAAEAIRLLRMGGVGGPWAIALGPRCFTGLMQATGRGGFPILDVVRQIVGGPVVWAPALDGAVVLSTRGGDFELTVGQDLSVGYARHDDLTVTLYFEESLAFRVLTPEAAVSLRYEH
jgi:uncharacterized linocin/CFP29 family protein